jgi:hypothetical protein
VQATDVNLVPILEDPSASGHRNGSEIFIIAKIRNNGTADALNNSTAALNWLGVDYPIGPIPPIEAGAEYVIAPYDPANPTNPANLPRIFAPSAPNSYPLMLRADSDDVLDELSGEGDDLTIQILSGQAQPLSTPWTRFAAIGLILAFSLVALMYMIGMFLNRPELLASAREEFYQLLFVGVIIALFAVLLTDVSSNYLPSATLALTNGTSTDLMGSARQVTSANAGDIYWLFANIEQGIKKVGQEASKSAYCSFLGAGYNVVTCTTLNAARGPLGTAYSALGLALADLSAQDLMLKLSDSFLLTLLLPIGIVMRTFRVMRQAGGALMAISLGFYFIFPAAVLFTKYYIVDPSQDTILAGTSVGTAAAHVTHLECTPTEMNRNEVTDYMDGLASPGFYRPILFIVLVKAVFSTILAVFITLGSIRYLASLLGAEIDVSALGRIS